MVALKLSTGPPEVAVGWLVGWWQVIWRSRVSRPRITRDQAVRMLEIQFQHSPNGGHPDWVVHLKNLED